MIATVAAWGFTCTRESWAVGIKGGVQFGALLGAVVGFTNFYWTLIFNGFPYPLAWAWFGVDLVGYGVAGAVLALFVKRAA